MFCEKAEGWRSELFLEEFSKKVEQQGQIGGQGKLIPWGEAQGVWLYCSLWVSLTMAQSNFSKMQIVNVWKVWFHVLRGGICDAAEGRKSSLLNDAIFLTFCSMFLLFVYSGFMYDYTYDYGFLEDFTRSVQFRQLVLSNFDFFFLSVYNVAWLHNFRQKCSKAFWVVNPQRRKYISCS